MRWSLLVLLALAGVAHADENAADREAAAAQQLLRAGDIPAACARFEAALTALAEESPPPTLDRDTAVRLAHADCRERNGELAAAWRAFGAIEELTRGASSRTLKVRGKTAVTRRRALEPRLSWLTISVGTTLDGMVVTRGERDVPAAEWNVALPVDPGEHTISVSAPGHNAWTTKVALTAAGERQTISVPALEQLPREPPVERPKPEPVVEVPAEPARPAARSGRRWIVLGVGVAALAAGGGALGLELAARRDYDASTREPDDARQGSLFDAAVQKRYLAQGLAGVAVAGAGVAVWLWLSSPDERAVHAAPVVGSDHVGAAVVGRF